MKNCYPVLLALLLCSSLSAQTLIRQISVSKSLTYNYIVRAGANKFGYAALATSKENVSSVMIAKLDNSLKAEWANFYTDSVNTPGTDLRQQITACRNGGFAAAFTPDSRNGSVFVLKTDSLGNLLWSREYRVNSGSQGTELMETPDGNLLVAGNMRIGFVVSAAVLSLDGTNGQIQWFKTLTIGGENAIVNALAGARDSGFVIAGTGTGNVMFIARYNKEGDMQWTRTYRAASQGNYFYQDVRAIAQTKDGGFAFTGLVPSVLPGNGYDMSVIKLGANGSLQWAKELGTTGEDGGSSIQQNSDSSYTITSTFTSANTWLVKLNKTGETSIFQRVLNDGYLSFPSSVQDNMGRYIMSGTAYTGNMLQPHGFIAAIGNDGSSCGGYLSRQPIFNLQVTPARYTIATSDIIPMGITDTAYFKKTSPPLYSKLYCSGDGLQQQGNVASATVQAHPSLKAELLTNPVKTTMQLKLSGGDIVSNWQITVNDINGRLMQRQNVDGAAINKVIDVSRWAPGMYIINITNGNWRQTIKAMVAR